MKKASELEPGDVIQECGVRFTVRHIANLDSGKTTIVFEDMPATTENMAA